MEPGIDGLDTNPGRKAIIVSGYAETRELKSIGSRSRRLCQEALYSGEDRPGGHKGIKSLMWVGFKKTGLENAFSPVHSKKVSTCNLFSAASRRSSS